MAKRVVLNNGEDYARLSDYIILGKYTGLVMITAFFSILIQAGNMTYMVYAGLEPKIHSCVSLNGTSENITERICERLDRKECTPQMEYEFYSINIEFNQLCSDSKNIKFSLSIQMLGLLIGSFIIGQISDNVGRKWTFFYSLLANFLFGLATALSSNFYMFTVIRFLTCFATGGHITVIFVLLCETYPTKQRFWLTMLMNWSPHFIIVPGIAHLCGDWRTFTIVLHLITIIPMTLLLFTFETPHFLLRKGNMEKAKRAMQGILLFSNQDYDGKQLMRVIEVERKISEEQTQRARKYTFFHLFSTWKLFAYTAILSSSYLITSFVNYGIMFDVGSLSGNVFINMSLAGCVKFVVNMTTAFCDKNFTFLGRRRVHIASVTYTVFAILSVLFLKVRGLSLPSLETFLHLSAMGIISQLYAVDGVISTELYPTPIRNTGFAFMQLTSRIGVLFAPFLPFLATIHPFLPTITMSSLVLLNLSAFVPIIPETKGRPLPDHMPSSEVHLDNFTREHESSMDLKVRRTQV